MHELRHFKSEAREAGKLLEDKKMLEVKVCTAAAVQTVPVLLLVCSASQHQSAYVLCSKILVVMEPDDCSSRRVELVSPVTATHMLALRRIASSTLPRL